MRAVCSNCHSIIYDGDGKGCPVCGYKGSSNPTRRLNGKLFEIVYYDSNGNRLSVHPLRK